MTAQASLREVETGMLHSLQAPVKDGPLYRQSVTLSLPDCTCCRPLKQSLLFQARDKTLQQRSMALIYLPDVYDINRLRKVDAVPATAVVHAELNVARRSLGLMPCHDEDAAMVTKFKDIGMISHILPAS